MGKRIGRRRLFALNKKGETETKTAAAGSLGAITSQTGLRDGSLITTDIQINLSPANAEALHSFNPAGAGTGLAADTAITGVSSSSGTHSAAELAILSNATNGLITSAELICVETPTGGGTHMGIWYANGSGLAGAVVSTAGSAVELIENTAYAIGTDVISIDIDADLDGKYLFIAHSGSADADYTAGKFVLRLYGYEVF
tara:strand:- start:227 stop:826 length:600 start_codon:yes stop_codon:yes gene_type:complete